MKPNIQQHLAILANDYGVHPGDVRDYMPASRAERGVLFGMDAVQPGTITTANSAIPGYLTNYLSPKAITVLVSPMKAEAIVGAEKIGDWTTATAEFPIIESVGETSAYGDFSNNGESNTNVNWVNRQSFHFQTNTEWGAQQLARAGAGRIDLAERLNIASMLSLNKYSNLVAFFGVAGLNNFGLLNDPSLSAPIAPATKAAGGVTWAVATAAEVYADILSIFAQLVSQSGGVLEMDAAMTLAMSPTIAVNLNKTNIYNVNVMVQLKTNFPNLRVETAVEYATTGGQLVQMIVNEVEGQKTASVAFTEKMRAFPVITRSSSWKQKKMAGSWGTIIFMPLAIAAMLGV
jgi:hypothetical protein